MDCLNPIFTETTTCQDCYKCLRECDVKAIQIERSCARILPEECTLCGHCVSVCPTGAKKVRDDTGLYGNLRAEGRPMAALLAPSWVGEYPGTAPAAMRGLLRGLGFDRVLEVSVGARATTAGYRREILEAPAGRKLFLSSACPAIVRYVRRYRPDLAPFLMATPTPLEQAARMAKRRWGEATGCVFFGPCIAKKTESDRNRGLVEAALSYRDLDALLADAAPERGAPRPPPAPAPASEAADGVGGADTGDVRTAAAAGEAMAKAALYPIDGGMVASLRQAMPGRPIDAMVFSGMGPVVQALDGLTGSAPERPLFLELMACEGGCVNGPLVRSGGGTVVKRMAVMGARRRPQAGFAPPEGPMPTPQPVRYLCAGEGEAPLSPPREFGPEELRLSLARVGKYSREDELNCSACGYDSCRDFAAAILRGKAETTMCVSWMRNLVQKKANALLAAMPAGVVILDRDLKIVESNRNFARMMGGDAEELFELRPGLAGADGRQILPRCQSFLQVLENPGARIEEDVDCRGRILHCQVFGIEAGQVAGGLFEDVTVPTVQRDRVVRQAQEVIEKHLGVVQQIAFLLGENAAESEAILNSIIGSFSGAGLPESKGGEP